MTHTFEHTHSLLPVVFQRTLRVSYTPTETNAIYVSFPIFLCYVYSDPTVLWYLCAVYLISVLIVLMNLCIMLRLFVFFVRFGIDVLVFCGRAGGLRGV